MIGCDALLYATELPASLQYSTIESTMPEYPDVTVYVEAISRAIEGCTLSRIRIAHPFLLRSVTPASAEAEGRAFVACRRIGKQIVIELSGEIHLVVHLMIAGRLRWEAYGAPVPRRIGLCALDFVRDAGGEAARPARGNSSPGDNEGRGAGTLILTEAGTKKRASLHIVAGTAALAAFARGGIEVLDASAEELGASLRRENHTLKRALTDPRLVSGVGNAYSDEILHRARLSPFKQTASLTHEEIVRLHAAGRAVLGEWADRLRAEAGGGFPAKVTAFHAEMAVHGRYGKPCPVCGTAVQHIVYAENECNYCPTCQTGGKLLADRALSRLLKDDWPATLAELEELKSSMRE
jgi:formamidopyrimidine-DNA glycosylase